MYNLLLSLLFISSISSAAVSIPKITVALPKFTIAPKKTSSGSNGLDEISGTTNLELFNKYRCRVCEDIMVDNFEFADGELKVNENVAIKFCETFVTKILHNQLGGMICNTVVRSKLDEIVKGLISTDSEVKLGKQICSRVNMCAK